MKKNMGSVDRVLRLVIGLAAGYWGYTSGNVIGYVVAGIMVGTALISVCPLYLPFGLSSGAKGPK